PCVPAATATPIRPTAAAGKPRPLNSVHVAPPFLDLYNPMPWPPKGGYVLHGGRRVRHRLAYTVWGLSGSAARSTAPVFSSLYKTFCHVLPPSAERNTPRSALGPWACPKAATRTILGFFR